MPAIPPPTTRKPPPTRPVRKPAPARPVADWLDGESSFRSLAARVDRLVGLQKRLVAACPGIPLTVVSLDADSLTVRTPSAAWAARLRQTAPTLLALVRLDCAEVTRIRIVPQRTGESAQPRATVPRPPVPVQALRDFERLGSRLPASTLAQALATLVRRQRQGGC